MKNVACLLILFASVNCFAQDYQQTAGFKYIEVVRNTDQKDADLPLVIWFHYSSSTTQESADQYDQLDVPVRIILPQGNFRKREGFTYFPADYYTKDSLTQMSIAKQTVDSIAWFVESIVKKYNRKAVVAGFSQGGDISFLLGIYYPQFLKAAFPLAGFIHKQRLDDVKIHAHKSIAINIYQGIEDKIVSIMYNQRMLGMLSPYFRISLKPYAGLGHDFSIQMKKDYAKRMEEFLTNK